MIKIKTLSNFICTVLLLMFTISSIIPSLLGLYSKYVLILDSILLTILIIINSKDIKKSLDRIILLIIILTISIFSIIFSKGGIGSFLNLFHFLGGIVVFSSIDFNKNLKKTIYFISIILWLYNIRLSFSIWNAYLSNNNIYNPNSVACFIFFTAIIIKIFLKEYNIKFVSILVYIVSLYCIYQTNCRSAFLAYILYLIVSLIPVFNAFIFKHSKIICYLLLIVGILFPLIYVNMYTKGIDLKLPFMEKGLYTGRESLWNYMLESLKREKYGYWFGLGTNYQTEFGVISNFHNWYIGVLYTFGIPLLILYFKLLINFISKLKAKDILYGFIAIFLIGFSEGIGLWITTQIYIFMLVILANILGKEDDMYDNSVHTNI